MPLSRPGASQVPGVNAVYSCPCPGGVRLSPPSAACGGKAYLFIWYFIWGGLFAEMKKRLFALFLCLCMVMTLLPVGAFAEGTEAQFGLADGGASVTSVNPVETPDTHITFKFYNGETLLDTQVVNGDGQLTAPATPAIEGGRKFLGWYAVDANDQLEAQEFDFSNAYTNYSGRSEVKVMAKFEAVFYVYFMTVDGQVHSTAIANEASGFKVALPTDYEPKGKVVTGWKANGAVFTADTVVSADTYVYPVTEDCYWVTFNTTGGSMVASCSVTKGDTLNLSGITAPTRTGYRFKGWSTTADGALISSVTPTADTTLYAVWEGDNVTYTVVYWGENPNNTATENIPFDTLLGTESKTAKVGTTVTGSASTANNNTIKNYFTYHSSDSAVVKADNSTVINVYYTRKSFSVTFDLGTTGSKSMTIGDNTYHSGWNATKYVLTAKYEQNIESLWPTASNFSSGSNFYGWDISGVSNLAVSKRLTMTADLCSSNGKTATANYNTNCLDHLFYMFESFDQTSPANGNERQRFNGVYYDKSSEYSQDANSKGGDWGQKAITGMKASGTQTTVLKDDGSWFNPKPKERNVFLYYTRNEYDFIKNNYGTVASEKVKFGASLADKGGEPARPAGFSENAVFKGWYEVPVGQITDSTLPYDFTGKTMPASKLTLFAYWVEKPVTLTVQVPTLGGYTASNYEVAIGTVISGVDVFKDAEAKIAAAGRTVLKWVYEDGTAVDVNSAIGSDTTVKAVLEGEVYNLTYVTGTDAAITDENRYEYEALAQVKDGSGLKSGDKVFAYWTDETGKVYYPGSYVTMTGNKTLTANYVDPSVKVTLTYHSNFDTDQTKTIDAVPNNDKVSVMDYTSTGLPSRLGYQVKGWKDANGVEYAAGSEARLDNNGSNDLYAVWEAIDVDYKVEFYYQNTDGTYPDKAKDENIVTRQGKTDSIVSVTATDKADKENGKYVYDTAASNIESGTVAADRSLVLKLYFKLNQSSYTVRYLWNGTEDKVADDKVVADQTVGQTITETPITVGGYTAVSTDSQSITLVPDSSSNVITFYYYKNVELTAISATHEYNGREQSVSGFTGAPEDADFSAITVGAAGTDVGEYPASFAEGTVGTKDSTGKYIVVKATDGMLKITPISNVITITANSKTREYNGEALTDNGCTFTEGVLVDGDVLQAVVEGSQTDKGSSANVVKSYKVMRGDVDVTDFYTFGEIENGTLTVTERKVTLTSKSADKPYDGTPLTSPDVTVSGEGFVDGEVSDIKAIGTITDKGSVPNTITFTEGENFKASNYIIVRETGTLTIIADATEVVVYISGNTGTEKYDGTEKTVTGYKVASISSDLYKESDFALTGNATVSATDAGATSYPMGLTAGNFENKNDNFSKVTFVVTDGSLTIDPRTVTLTSESATKEYDGTPLTRPDVTVSGDGFVEGEVSGIKATGSITYYGEVDNDIKYTKEAGYKDSNYIVTSEIGKLGITRSSKELKVVANSGTWEYDGKFHADGGYTVTFGEESYTVAAGESAKLSTGDTVTAIITKQVKNVADSAGGNNAIVTLTIDNTAQYANVSQANGTLTITAKPLTITADSAEKVYDGQPLTKNSFTNTELADGDKLTATVTGSQTNVGSSDNVASAAVIMAGEENVTANYTITYEKGSLTVTPVTDEVIVTVTERGGDYLYDGGEKVVTGYDAVSSNPLYTANDYSFSGDATVKSTNAGSYDMELAPEDFKNTSANFTNVTFIIVDGKLNIAQRKVLMTSADDEKVYDGTPLTNSTVTVTGDGFAEGEGAAYTVTGSQLDEGSSNNSFTYELNEGTLAANYIIETKEGELTVKPILTEITITANSGEKMYDGSALINGGYTFTSGILVDGDVLTAVVEGSQLNAGSSANVVKSYRVMRGETDVTANYRFAESVDGKLTVTARKVVMTSADDEKVYDGTPLTNDEITVTGDGFIEGEGVTYDVTGSQLDVGSSDNSFTYELNEGTLAENYIIETEEGKLTVTSPEQHIVITANSAEKTYDGTPLTDDGFTYTDFVLAEGDVLEAVVEGSQTDAGSSVNVIKSYRVMRGDEDVTANYIFDDSVDGTLTVTKRKVTLTSGTACKIYDGKYLTCNKVEVGGDGFVEGEGATYDVTGKRKDIGWSYNDFTYKLNDNTKADNYEITVERGFLYVKDQAEKPKTGDSSDLLLLLALMSMSGAGAAGTVYLYRRKREEQE